MIEFIHGLLIVVAVASFGLLLVACVEAIKKWSNGGANPNPPLQFTCDKHGPIGERVITVTTNDSVATYHCVNCLRELLPPAKKVNY